MSSNEEMLLKRVEALEKNVKISFSNIEENLHQISCGCFYNIYHYLAREIKNEADIDLLKEYLVNNNLIDFPTYTKFRKEHPLMRTYIDENKNALKMYNFYKSSQYNPQAEESLFNYINNSNLLIQKQRFKIKRQLLIERGYAEDSEEVLEVNKLIKMFDEQIKYKDTPPLKEKEYYMKKKIAQKIYDDYFTSKNDEVIERIREIPLLTDTHFEPSCKALYFETISNYWIGNYNAAIVLLSVFVEAYLKEQYYFATKEDSDETLTNLINTCLSKNIITSEQQTFLLSFANAVRNNYIHVRYHNIVPDVTVPVSIIDLNSPSDTELNYGTSEQYPFLRDITKMGNDKAYSKDLIIAIAKIVIKISGSPQH